MTRYIRSPSLKARLVALVLARWQACSGTVQDGGNAGEEFLCVGICEVFFGYERSACIPTHIRKSCLVTKALCVGFVKLVVCVKGKALGDRLSQRKSWSA
ncbi:hypothetical protein AVEN_183578-1 [Araneus ventricosus]|uniref:Secreted protein n=1 Tax=Araneus ventricosus TaxID=182803 RepID=A0A4Y2GY99_ARAVE|nr:hypothetical protein AVEN_183578-1 [Araneus ventricosus]